MRWARLTLLPGLLAAGCTKQDADKLANLGKIAAREAEAGLSSLRQALAKSGPGAVLEDQALAQRVTDRLRHDKGLAGAAVEVAVKKGVVELRGAVGGPPQRRRAVELAEQTTGVEKVKDELKCTE